MATEFIINFLIGFMSAVLASIAFFWLFYTKQISKLTQKSTLRISELEEESKVRLEEIYTLRIQHTKDQEELKRLKDELLKQTHHKEEQLITFENIAQKILDEKSQKIEQSQQHNLSQILEPFKENIKTFNQKIESYYQDEAKERFSLTKEIERLHSLNEQISQDAINLTKALKGDNKVQGDWGEYILERVLESSGLQKGREYEIQQEYKDTLGNRMRPDVIVHLPDQKDVIVDSKLSLTAYEKYHTSEEDEKEDYLKKHLDSIYTHIRQLSSKNYHKLNGIKTLDFVLMFIPIEAAFLLALEKDKTLYEKAYNQNIILVSPSTLLAVLRTIQNSWRYEYQNKNAHLIAKKAGDMHDKFIGFVEEMQTIEKSLQKAQLSYTNAFKKLSSGKGNLVTRAKQLKALDNGYSEKESKRLFEE